MKGFKVYYYPIEQCLWNPTFLQNLKKLANHTYIIVTVSEG